LLSFLVSVIGCSSYVAVLKKSGPQPQSGIGGQIFIVTSSNLASTYGTPVTFTATAPSGATGLVNFLDSGNIIGSAALNQNVATFITSSLKAGSHEITAVWAGDSISGPMESGSIVQTVGRAVPILAWPTPASITYGAALGEGQLDANYSGIPGTFIYTPEAGAILPAGDQTLTATFIPTDTVDYATTTQTALLTVNKATPAITWPVPPPIKYGVPLSSSQLNASSPVAGTFTYSPSLTTVLPPGSQALSVTFTPTDSTDYNSTSATVTQAVMLPSVIVNSASSAVLGGTSITLSASVTGTLLTSVQWEVNGIPGGNAQVGSITSSGNYTAPTNLNTKIDIEAVLQANPSFQGALTIQVIEPESAPGTIGFAYDLPIAAATSAGVYDTSGNLIRTLWSNESLAAGPQAATWDGNDDFGNTAPVGSYQIRVLYNNVRYTWGLIGDTSGSWIATNSWDQQNLLPKGMAIIGDTAYVAEGYEERRPNASMFSLANPEQAQALFEVSQCMQTQYIATDGRLLYFASTPSGWPGSVSYVFAYDPSTHQFYDFPMGISFTSTNPKGGCGTDEPRSVIDYVPPPPGTIAQYNPNGASGLAVQSTGHLLAIAHGAAEGQSNQNVIRLFDKTSGQLVGFINIPDPKGLAFENNGDLWAISGTSVVLISDLGKSNVIIRQLPDLSAPLAIAVDPSTNDVLVSDGGTAQQIKRFSETGQLLSTYGDAGGYTDCDPTVTTSRLFLDTTAGPGFNAVGTGAGGMAFITVAPDGSYWFGDQGNARVLHISSDGQYLGQIAFLRYLYNIAADHGDPSRIFAEDLEYHVDYAKPLLPGDPDPALGGNGSWALVRNWSACLPSNYKAQFRQVQTFSNGRTYAAIDSTAGAQLAELPATGPIRFSGRSLQNGGGANTGGQIMSFTHAGNLADWGYFYYPSGSFFEAFQQDLLGYDAEGWPVWGPAYKIASQSLANSTDPVGINGCCQWWWPEPTSGGLLATFEAQPITMEPNHHLGGIRIGGTTWTWKASPGAMIETPDGKGTFPDGILTNAGLAALVEGDYIFEGYNGNYGSFSSQWMQWSQDGLLIGQFGNPAFGLYEWGPYSQFGVGPGGGASDGTLFPGAAGNDTSMATVAVDGDIYVYSSDEGYHHGIHQWKVSGLDSIHELKGSASLGKSVILH